MREGKKVANLIKAVEELNDAVDRAFGRGVTLSDETFHDLMAHIEGAKTAVREARGLKKGKSSGCPIF